LDNIDLRGFKYDKIKDLSDKIKKFSLMKTDRMKTKEERVFGEIPLL